MSDSANSVDLMNTTPASPTDAVVAPAHSFKALHVSVSELAHSVTSKKALIFALILLVAVAFANSVNGDFVHDDTAQITGNPMLGHWDGETLKRALTRDFWAGVQPELAGDKVNSLYYRPAFTLFLMLAYEVAGHDAAGWHLIVLMLHALCATLAFIVLDKTLQHAASLTEVRRRLLAAVAAAVFTVHPAQAESVTWIAGLVGPLSTLLMLAGFYCYLKYRDNRRLAPLLAMMWLFALAMLAKESAIVFLLIVAAHEWLIFNRGERAVVRLRQALLPVGVCALTAAGYMTLRYLVLGMWFGRINNLNFPDDALLTFADVVRTWPALILAYGKLIVLPIDLSLMYDFGYFKASSWTTFWMPLLVLLTIAIIAWRFAARSGVMRLAAIWLVVPLLPHLNTRVFVSDEIIHDRYLYLSLLGVGIFVAALVVQAAGSVRWFSPRVVVALTLTCLAALTLLTLTTNRRFQNGDVLWKNIATHAPHSRIALIAAALMAEERGDTEAALRAYEATLAINPDILDALNNSAFIYARTGHWDEATRRFEHIVELSPDRPTGHFNLAFAYAVARRYDDAAREQQKAIDLAPNHPRVDEWRARLAQLKQAAGTATKPE